MTNFKIGDKFIPHKPKAETWGWVPEMDDYDGKIMTVEDFDSGHYLLSDGWAFHVEWCEKIEPIEEYFNAENMQKIADKASNRFEDLDYICGEIEVSAKGGSYYHTFAFHISHALKSRLLEMGFDIRETKVFSEEMTPDTIISWE